MPEEKKPVILWRYIGKLEASARRSFSTTDGEPLWKSDKRFGASGGSGSDGDGTSCKFACITVVEKRNRKEFLPTSAQLLKHPSSILALVHREATLFAAGAVSGAVAKTATAPLERIKLLMQTHGARIAEEGAKKSIGFIEVIRIIPYSAIQLFAYENYKNLFRGEDGELSLIGRLAAGACAGMTSTFVTYPLDVLRLRMAVDPGFRTASEIALSMLREEGITSYYSGLGPSLFGIAPYIAVNFCIFDLVKKSLPEEARRRTETSVFTALLSASLATVMCYPLDTVRRQMQMKGTPYKTVFDAFAGIWASDGFIGFYRGLLPNFLKNLPSSSIKLTTYDFVKRLIETSENEYQRITEENREKYNKKFTG
ncbi:probable envelope ADP,ATP carrier protein, chloroplastic isoform X2 [Cucumis sativus]|uniref:probable envelope ADP,ATP carrier protein, chloroplastic isoform X2 n=1 Tax=Cucumis sativus TaxID=3659 RepID=UPI0005EC4935|nr:probable envelope ADP,ATP carrier protein, chloroplastic isoform X2 [Cucumis sativus]